MMGIVFWAERFKLILNTTCVGWLISGIIPKCLVNDWFMLVDFRDTSVDIGLKSFTTEHLMNHEGRRDDKQISRRTKGQRVRQQPAAVWMGLIVGLPKLNLYVLCVLMVCWPALYGSISRPQSENG